MSISTKDDLILSNRVTYRGKREMISDTVLRGNIVRASKWVLDYATIYKIDNKSVERPDDNLKLKCRGLARLLVNKYFIEGLSTSQGHEFINDINTLSRQLAILVNDYGEEGKIVLEEVNEIFSSMDEDKELVVAIDYKVEREEFIWRERDNFISIVRQHYEKSLSKCLQVFGINLNKKAQNNELKFRLFQPNIANRYSWANASTALHE